MKARRRRRSSTSRSTVQRAGTTAELEVLLYEFKDGLNQYLKASGSPHASLEALIAFNKAHADTVMPFFGQELFERAQAKGPLTDARVSQGARRRAAARGQGRPAGRARSRQARCRHRAEHVAGVADRSRAGRPFRRRRLRHGRGRRHAEHHGARGRRCTACRSGLQSWGARTPRRTSSRWRTRSSRR